MTTAGPNGERGQSQMRDLCKSHMEALHTLHFLLEGAVEPGSDVSTYVGAVKHHLDCLTKVLCLDR